MQLGGGWPLLSPKFFGVMHLANQNDGKRALRRIKSHAQAAAGWGCDPGTTPPHFYQTKPFVMLKETHLYGSERIRYVDYRKMTNGFVFREFV